MDEGGQRGTPTRFEVVALSQGAQLRCCEPLAERMELPGRVERRTATEPTAVADSIDPYTQPGQGSGRGRAELVPQLRRRQSALDDDGEQGRMLPGETPKHHTRVDEVSRRVVSDRQPGDGRAEELVGADPEGDDEPVFGAEETVDGAGGRPRIIRHGTNRQRREPVGLESNLTCFV